MLHHRLKQKDVELIHLNEEKKILREALASVEADIEAVMDSDNNAISSHGGKTVVEITTPDAVELKSETVCSLKDNYNKKIGARIAIGRALTSLGKTV